jgi:hypothetical protein
VAWLRRQEQQRKAATHRADLELRRKCSDSRSRWQIDELSNARDEAKAELNKLGGFWSRVFRRKAISEARDKVQDLEKRLAERTARYKADVSVYREEREALGGDRKEKTVEWPMRTSGQVQDGQTSPSKGSLEADYQEWSRSRRPPSPEHDQDHGHEIG